MIAKIRIINAGFRAELDDGRTVERADIQELAISLHTMGVTAGETHCGDWRESEYILMSGQQIALKVALRKLDSRHADVLGID
jgi:hypothetical protein